MVVCANIYCGTFVNITKHHLIPKPYRKGWSGKIPRVHLCEECHKHVHRLKHNSELAEVYNTKSKIIELLASDVQFRLQRMMMADLMVFKVHRTERNYSPQYTMAAA
jgi:hypothetical protein